MAPREAAPTTLLRVVVLMVGALGFPFAPTADATTTTTTTASSSLPTTTRTTVSSTTLICPTTITITTTTTTSPYLYLCFTTTTTSTTRPSTTTTTLVGGVCMVDADCDDGDACTTERCAGGLCRIAAVICDGGDACNGTFTCVPATGCALVLPPPNCDDGDACTIDQCDAGTCRHRPLMPLLPICYELFPYSFPNPCGDGISCTIDRCVPATGCVHESSDAHCGNTPCSAGRCAPDGCHYDPVTNGTPCGATACTNAGTCFEGSCTNTTPVDCGGAEDQCTGPPVCCESVRGCYVPDKPDGTPCDAGSPPTTCSVHDGCRAGTCQALGGGDADGDGICAADDDCAAVADPDQRDLDQDGIGDVCDDADGELRLRFVKLTAARGGMANGSLAARGDVSVVPPDAIDVDGGVTVRVRDGLASAAIVAWASNDCRRSTNGVVKCVDVGHRQRLLLKPTGATRTSYRVSIRAGLLALPGPFQAPVDVTMAQGQLIAGIDRAGTLSRCKPTTTGLRCVAR